MSYFRPGNISNQTMQQDELRRTLRTMRQQLATQLREQAAKRIVTLIAQTSYWQQAHSIALYCAQAEELDPCHLQHLALQQNKRCFVPVLAPGQRLLFSQIDTHTQWQANRYGINEPVNSPCQVEGTTLDLVFLPMVGFDAQGHRLGMGAGYYDRSFAKLTSHCKLIGIAFDCQQVASLPVNPWDVDVHAILTETRLLEVS